MTRRLRPIIQFSITSITTLLTLVYSNRCSKSRCSIRLHRHPRRQSRNSNRPQLSLALAASNTIKDSYSSSTVSYNLVILVGDYLKTHQARVVTLIVSAPKVILKIQLDSISLALGRLRVCQGAPNFHSTSRIVQVSETLRNEKSSNYATIIMVKRPEIFPPYPNDQLKSAKKRYTTRYIVCQTKL